MESGQPIPPERRAAGRFIAYALLALPLPALAHGVESAGVIFLAVGALGAIVAAIALCFIKERWWVKLLIFLPMAFSLAYAFLFVFISYMSITR